MTVALPGRLAAQKVMEQLPAAVTLCDGACIWVRPEQIAEVARFLRDTPGLEFDYLTSVTATDFWDYFELVYQLTSLKHNHSLVMRCQLTGRENLEVPSVVGVWRGADWQEREVYDLLGIGFSGHPSLKRILTWEGFPGHPLRKDWL